MPDAQRCSDVRELIPELAMGVASGEARAQAMAHIVGCPDCRHELEGVARVVDELLLLAPEREPPPGFDSRVLSGLDLRPARHGVRNTLLVAAAAVLVAAIAAGTTWWQGADDRKVAGEYHQVLAAADGSSMRAAQLTTHRTSAGNVFAYQGKPSWLFVNVEDAASGTYHVQVVTDDGRAHWLGLCKVRDREGAWGTTVDLPIGSVDRVEMFRGGLPTLTADL